MGFKPLDPAAIAAVKAAGFRVFMSASAEWRSYLYFSDGQNIGYLQRGDYGGYKLSTVHIPNQTTGTGFDMGPTDLSPADLRRAFLLAPSWAHRQDVEASRKFADLSAWMGSSRLGSDIIEI